MWHTLRMSFALRLRVRIHYAFLPFCFHYNSGLAESSDRDHNLYGILILLKNIVTTACITHPRYVEHTLPGHPEHAGRIQAVWRELENAGLSDRMRSITPEPITDDLVLAVHTQHYFDSLKWIATHHQEIMLLNPDTYFGPTSLEVARLAAGGVVRAVDEVLSSRVSNAMAAVRPPGHHAVPDNAMGFCLLGNVAIAIRYAQRQHHLDRLMIVDYDVHHGNGTQDMLYDDPHALFVSTHQYPFYPGTGAIDETGTGEGRGYTVNIPLNAGHGDRNYAAIYEHIIWPLAERYKPQLLVVSAGFDAHWDDPLAHMRLSLPGYAHLTRELIKIAEKLCEGRIVFALEGGYNLDTLAHGVRNIAHALLGDDEISDPLGPAPTATEPDIEPLIAQIRQIHRL